MPDSAEQRAESTRPIVEVRDLTVSFDTVEGKNLAIDRISFDILPQRTLGIVGESGCGKSATARAIMRIEDDRICSLDGQILFSRGDETIDLVEFKPSSPVLRDVRGREIGLIFQEPMTSFSPVHTIGNQIIEAVRLHLPMSRAQARTKVIEQLRDVGMPHPEHILGQYAWELSGGLRQRAMIAMALVCGPRLVIADEPTTALDVTTQAQVLKLLEDLKQQREMALMLITHDLGVVAETADDVAIMYLGTIAERGPVESIFGNPMHPYTRLLLDTLPSISHSPTGPLKTIEGTVPSSLRRPPGCPFHTRCPEAIAGVCDRVQPEETMIDERHIVSCHLHSPS